LAILPLAAAGNFLTGLSPIAQTQEFFATLTLLTVFGLMAFLIVGFGRTLRAGGPGMRSGRAGIGNGGFGGGFGGGAFGGGGAAGTWWTWHS
jgi:uncharacterized membrane protein YgcG